VVFHGAELLIPTLTRTRRGTNDQLIAFHCDLNLRANPDLLDKQFWDPDATRVANPDNPSLHSIHVTPGTYIVITIGGSVNDSYEPG
jgi:hypothetical protein